MSYYKVKSMPSYIIQGMHNGLLTTMILTMNMIEPLKDYIHMQSQRVLKYLTNMMLSIDLSMINRKMMTKIVKLVTVKVVQMTVLRKLIRNQDQKITIATQMTIKTIMMEEKRPTINHETACRKHKQTTTINSFDPCRKHKQRLAITQKRKQKNHPGKRSC